MAQACGLRGVKVGTVAELEKALLEAVEGQMKRGETTLVEVLLNQDSFGKTILNTLKRLEALKMCKPLQLLRAKELGEPFRRDAMKAPVQIAKINASDMSE